MSLSSTASAMVVLFQGYHTSFYRQLTGDDCGLAGVPVLDEFHKVHQLLAVQDLHPEVLDNKQIHFGHSVEELRGLGFNA